MSAEFSLHRQRFLEYAAEFEDVPDAAPLRLKVEHTLRVVEHAGTIVDNHPEMSSAGSGHADGEACRAAVLAALYHDCGRFPQFRKYRTFLDSRSANHAFLSLQTIRDRSFLQEESSRVCKLVQCAVLLHNRHMLSPLLDPAARFVTNVVRDSDKLDIIRIMVGYLDNALPEKDAVLLHVQDDPDRWSPEVADDVVHGHIAKYTDLRFINDFRLLLGTWMLELRFPVTRRKLVESGLMENVLGALPDAPGLRPARNRLYALLESCRSAGEVF